MTPIAALLALLWAASLLAGAALARRAARLRAPSVAVGAAVPARRTSASRLDYELVRQIGSDPSGDVWEARDHRLGRDVVVRKVKAPAGSPERWLALVRARRDAAVDVVERPEELWLVYESPRASC